MSSLRDALADISQQHLAIACCELSRRGRSKLDLGCHESTNPNLRRDFQRPLCLKPTGAADGGKTSDVFSGWLKPDGEKPFVQGSGRSNTDGGDN